MRLRTCAVSVLLFLLCLLPVGADTFEEELFSGGGDFAFGEDNGADSLFSADETSLFSDSGPLVSEVNETGEDLASVLLSGDEPSVVLGGNLVFSFAPSLIHSSVTESWLPAVSGALSSLFTLDARIDDDLRFYTSYDVDLAIGSGIYDFTLSLKEVFADLTYADTLFLRAGKQTITWGVGYFFSPADSLNLSDIDPENAEGEVEGPVALKMNLPLSADNLYGYLVLPPSLTEPSDIAYAVKYEKVVGGTELGFGAFYRYDTPPSLSLTFSGTLGEIALFGEAVAQYGSEKQFITGGSTPSVRSWNDRIFFFGTAGGRYTYSAEESDVSVTLVAQYYYNGEGYSDSAFSSAVPALLSSGDITWSDLETPGRHYGAASLSVGFTDDISMNCFVISNLSDASGYASASLNYSGIEHLTLELSAGTTFGEEGTEYTVIPVSDTLFVSGRTFTASIGVTLSGITF